MTQVVGRPSQTGPRGAYRIAAATGQLASIRVTPFLAGAAGGISMAVFNALRSLSGIEKADKVLVLRRLNGLLIAACLHGALGGLVAWGTQGRAGDFITGLAAVGFVAVLGNMSGTKPDATEEVDIR